MLPANELRNIPSVPGIYALYGGLGRNCYPVYVRKSKNLRTRIEQHLLRHNSSVTTGESAVKIELDNLTELRWWTHDDFKNPVKLGAAEIVASRFIKPIVRSRGTGRSDSETLSAEIAFSSMIIDLLENRTSGRLILYTLDRIVSIIQDLEKRLETLEKRN